MARARPLGKLTSNPTWPPSSCARRPRALLGCLPLALDVLLVARVRAPVGVRVLALHLVVLEVALVHVPVGVRLHALALPLVEALVEALVVALDFYTFG